MACYPVVVGRRPGYARLCQFIVGGAGLWWPAQLCHIMLTQLQIHVMWCWQTMVMPALPHCGKSTILPQCGEQKSMLCTCWQVLVKLEIPTAKSCWLWCWVIMVWPVIVWIAKKSSWMWQSNSCCHWQILAAVLGIPQSCPHHHTLHTLHNILACCSCSCICITAA